MKQMNLLRVGVLLVAALFVVGALTTGGFAKYITGSTGHDDARVAMFGVEIQVGGNAFAKNYAGSVFTGTNAVLSSLDDYVVAPGTNSTEANVTSTFGATGTPEVAVKVYANMSNISEVVLPAGTYTDYTLITGYDEEGKPTYDTFTLDEAYYPVVFTLQQTNPENSTPIATGNLTVIKAALDALGGFEYEAGSTLDSEFELTWEWDFDDGGAGTNDKADTFLGMVAAGVEAAPAGASTTIEYDVEISVTQID